MNALSTEVLLDNLHELLATMPDAERIHSLKARIVPGLGVAQGTLARQLPLISGACQDRCRPCHAADRCFA